jgi:hypothetical protein
MVSDGNRNTPGTDKKNTGQKRKTGGGGNVGGNIAPNLDDQAVDELLTIWASLDDRGRRDLLSVARDLWGCLCEMRIM